MAAYNSISKDIVHVRTALPFCAEALDVKFTDFFDEIVVTLNMLQLATLSLYPGKERKHIFHFRSLKKEIRVKLNNQL